MQLELGIIPIKFLLKLKRLNFLYYILNEDTDSMISQVYHTMKEDSKKGDYISLINKDKLDLGINLTDSEIKDLPKSSWKRYIKETVTSASLLYLVEENGSKNKTKHIVFNELTLNEYLKKNEKNIYFNNYILYKVKDSRDKKKNWAPWTFENDLCVACDNHSETMCHL